jgi:hypothetical protein
MGLKLLPGRVAIRELDERPTGLIVFSDYEADYTRRDQKSVGKLAQSSHRGRVLDVGPPARMPWGTPLPLGFGPGDEVVYVFGPGMIEEARRGEWMGEPCVWIAQEEVQAVVERT